MVLNPLQSAQQAKNAIRKHKSDARDAWHIASLVQTGFAVALVLVWAIGAGFGDAYNVAYVRIYTMMAVQGVVWILAIQAVCALAVILWHRPGTNGYIGLAWTRMLHVRTTGDLLKQFAQRYLGQGAPTPKVRKKQT